MSGPWDRPSQDREPPAPDEDSASERERTESGPSSGDAWPSNDLWSDQRPEAGSGWDDWSTLRAPDDFVLDEPVSTLGDPWAESWADEIADREPSADASDEERWAPSRPDSLEPSDADRSAPEPEPEPAAWAAPPEWTADRAEDTSSASESDDAPAEESVAPEAGEAAQPAWEPEPPTDPWGGAASAEPPTAAEPEPQPEPEPSAPRVAPWQTSDDPWAAVVEPEAPSAAEAPVAEDVPGVEAAEAASDAAPPDGNVDAAADAPAAASEESASTGGWRRDLLPAWLTGRAAAAADEPGADEPPVAEAGGADAPSESEVDVAEVAPVAAAAEEPPEAAAEPGADVFAAPQESFEADAPDAERIEAEAHEAEPFVAEAHEAEPFVAEAPEAEAPEAEAPEAEPFLAEPESGTDAQPEPMEAESTVAPVPAVAWEDDAPSSVDEASMPMSTDAADAPTDAGDGDTDADAAAELETPATTASDAWPDTDVAGAPTAASAEPDADERDRRFDAFIGGSLIGASAAAGAADEEASVDAEAEPALETAPVEREEPAALDEAVEPAPIAETEAPEAEAWVAEPEAWEPDTSAEDHPQPAIAAEDAVAEPEPEDPAAAWRAAAAAAASAAVVRTPEIQAQSAATDEPTTPEGPAEPEAPAADLDATARSGDAQPTWRPEWLPDLEEMEADERTSVLPTDWTPPPMPVLEEPAEGSSLAPHAGVTRTRPTSEADRELEEEDEAGATTAEQAVPWLIGFILLLAGMVIVLLALIFAGDASLGGGSEGPTPQPSLAAGVAGSPQPSATPLATVVPSVAPASTGASASAAPSGEVVAAPEYGPLEMVFQGRAAALAPIYLLHREFTTEPEAAVLAQDPNLDLRRYGWAMDGTKGAGLYADLLVSIEPGVEKRQLADEIATVTFGPTSDTVYAVRVTPDGANDVAVVLAVDFVSGDASELARFRYPRPDSNGAAPLQQAQYEDEGGPVRLYWMEDNRLQLWVVNGGMWEIDPASGDAVEIPRRPPVLWSPDGRNRIELAESSGTTTLTWIDMDGDERGTASVEGLVSHLRWSPESDRIVFTLGRSASGGGVLQDLWLWDLGEEPPTQITATGAAFGAEWMGSRVRWREDPGEA